MKRHTLFRYFYGSLFWILVIILAGLILVTPGDLVRQSLSRDNPRTRTAYFIVIGGAYGGTTLVGIVIYSMRILTNMRVIAAIPKSYIPVEKGEVGKSVRKMIVASLNRSAAIAWDSRPRIPDEPPPVISEPENRNETADHVESESDKNEGLREQAHSRQEKDGHTVTITPNPPVWGDIAHNGWSTPTSPDLPNLQYITVILELPHLIEAKAVSLAPLDPRSASEAPMPDIRAVDLLQRRAAMGLRDYISHLTSVGVITSPSVATEFLTSYEYARFAARPLSEIQFRDLMKQFAELLRNMNPLAPEILASLDIDLPSDSDGELSSTSTPTTPRSRSLDSSRSGASRDSSEGTIRTAPSRNPGPNRSPRKEREKFSTAPATPKSKKRMISNSPSTKRTVCRSASMNSFAQSRRPYNGSSGNSSDSLRSTSQGSVIRLSKTNEEVELPYVLKIPRARQ